MSDITITPSQVFASIYAQIGHGTAGQTITQGQLVYLKDSDRRLYLASSLTLAESRVIGIARSSATSGQPLGVTRVDPSFSYGGNEASGSTLYLSSTPGALTTTYPGTGKFVVVLGVTFGGFGAPSFDSTEITFDSTGYTFDEINISQMNLAPIENGPYTP